MYDSLEAVFLPSTDYCLLSTAFCQRGRVDDDRRDDDGPAEDGPTGGALAEEEVDPERVGDRLDVADQPGVERAHAALDPVREERVGQPDLDDSEEDDDAE